jgi:hypothetical protein
MTLREFLTAIKSAFNLEYRYNPQRAEVEIIAARLRRSDLIAGAPDMTQHAVLPLKFSTPDKELSTIRSLGFKVDESDELQKDLQPWQQPFVLNPAGNKDVVIELVSMRDAIDGVPWPPLLDFFFAVPHLQVELPGVINGSGSPAKLRLCHYRGTMPLTGIPIATSRNLFWILPAGEISLEWQGAAGLYQRFWKNFVELRNDRTLMQCSMTYPPDVIGSLEDFPAQFIQGSLYVWQECDHESQTTGEDQSKVIWVVM